MISPCPIWVFHADFWRWKLFLQGAATTWLALPSGQPVFVGAQPKEAAGSRTYQKVFLERKGKIKALGRGGRWNRMHNASEGCLNPFSSTAEASEWSLSKQFSTGPQASNTPKVTIQVTGLNDYECLLTNGHSKPRTLGFYFWLILFLGFEEN